MNATPSQPTSFSFSRALEILVGILGLALLGFMIHKIGWGTLVRQIKELGGLAPVFFCVIYAAAQICFTLAWRAVLDSPRWGISFFELFRAYLAGDALNMTIPSGNLAGEPIKVMLLKDKIPTSDAVVSVTLYKMADFISMTLFLALGLLTHFFFFELPQAWWVGGAVVAAGMSGGCVLLFLLEAKGAYASTLRFLSRLPWGDKLIHKMESAHWIDGNIRNFLNAHRGQFALSIFYNFLAWFGGVLEIYLFCAWMHLPRSWAAALTIETFSLFINNVSFFVPARVGVIEGGRVMLFAALGYSESAGLAYAFLRRLRELIWIAPGLFILLLRRRSKT
jgi:uncharacterized protein (TIRG00374 family)